MLETTLATTFQPGTNLKGEVAGANWTFLLPSLENLRILCLGAPTPAALTTFSQLGRVTIVEEAPPSIQHAGVERAISKAGQCLPLPDAHADLIVINGASSQKALAGDAHLQAELKRVLAPRGLVYLEPRGWPRDLQATRLIRRLSKTFGSARLYWLTPQRGECHTAVPAADRATLVYFLDERLHSPSLTADHFSSFKRLLKKRRAAGPKKETGDAAQASNVSPRADFIPGIRSVANAVLDATAAAERLMLRHLSFARRRGALLGSGAQPGDGRPPEYLCRLAQEDGVDITKHRWGVVARGDYSSRKVLFFLFDDTGGRSGRDSPAYVVKMVRDARFNSRLENEHRALAGLQDLALSKSGTTPRLAFWGYHNGLAMIGETAIEGAPFRARTRNAADCPYLLTALNWFTTLAVETATPRAATPAEVASALGELFDQFREIYRLAPAHETFLEEQFAALAAGRQAFPLVFQHGDPGPWNALVTPDEKVAFLDWEAAEPHGMPLWDLFYFMRSYSIGAARANGTHNRLNGFTEQFLSDTPLSRLFVETVEDYCRCAGLHPAFVQPLFYICWMHRALKESARLSDVQLEKGHYVNLLRLCIESRQSPTLVRLFSGLARDDPSLFTSVNGEPDD